MLLLLLLLPFLSPPNFCQCQTMHPSLSVHGIESPSSALLAPSKDAPSRVKRQYSPAPSSPCSGCPSKFTPVNCKCTSTPNDDLLCRCDRAILANVRDEPDRPQCPCRRGAATGGGGGDSTNFRGEISELTSRVQNLGVHSACHPICQQSCINSCTRPVAREGDYRDRERFPFLQEADQQHSPSSPVQHQYPLEQLPGCQPSMCRANCLRACSRILEGQRPGPGAAGEFGERASNPYQENLAAIEPPPHYEVRPVDPFAAKLGPEFPQLSAGKGTPEAGSSQPSSCQCSSGAFCDCPETCFPQCFDSCESNCNNHPQTSQIQRRMCAQSCHYECQRNCAEKQRQKQLRVNGPIGNGNGNELSGNGAWPLLSAESGIPQIGERNEMNSEFTQEENGATAPVGCMAKCPKSCEVACAMQNNVEDPTNCVPACVAVCAQSCAKGLGQFDHSPAANSQQFSKQIERQAQQHLQQQQMPFQQNIAGFERLSSPMDGFGSKLLGVPMAALAFDLGAFRLQNGSASEGAMQRREQGPGPGPVPNEESQKQQQPVPNERVGGPRQLPPTMFLNDGTPLPFSGAFPRMAFNQPCAPLCQPECTEECTRRYLEKRGPANEKQRPIPAGMRRQAGSEPGGEGASGQPRLFPPHYILPLADDQNMANGTDESVLEELEEAKAMDDVELEALLRPQNETGQTGNSTQTGPKGGGGGGKGHEQQKQRTVKQPSAAVGRPWKGKTRSAERAEEFFRRRMGPYMKGSAGGTGKAAGKEATGGQKGGKTGASGAEKHPPKWHSA